jgi:hypothetical protein
MIRLSLLFMLTLITLKMAAQQQYDTFFKDSTLRMDLILAGNDKSMQVYLHAYSKSEGWAGRRHNLSNQQNLGHGLAVMRDAATGEIIYSTVCSALFSEWQATDEAKEVQKAFQQVLLFPFPKKKAVITIEFRGYDGVYHTYLQAPVDPSDLLIRPKSETTYKKEVIQKNGSSAQCVDIVYVAEGYTEGEQDKFFADARRLNADLFAHEPFDKLKNKFNVTAVAAVSSESGTSHPGKGVWKNTLLDAHYDTFYSSRYLMSNQMIAINDAIAGVPYEQIIVVVNTPVYGGGGIFNSHTMISADDKLSNIIVVHEFAHAFAGLADEYYYPGDVMENFYNKKIEPWEENITTLVDFDRKWKDMLPKDAAIPTKLTENSKLTLGVYEGGGYATLGIYRPMQDCRMNTNKAKTFCPVCQRALIRVVDYLTK